MAFLRPAEGSRPPGRARALLLVLATVATALSGAGCAWLCGLAGYERRGEDRRAATPTAAPEVRRARSPAGHDVVVLAEPASPTVAVQLWSRRGPGDEPTDFAGLAALCGEAACTVRPAPPGVEVSGWTSLDSTVCEIVAPAGLEDVAIDHAAGLLAPDRSALEQRLVKVTPLVMARWRESRQDSHRVLLERLFSLTFGAGAYASPVLAHPPSLEGARLAEAAAHCASWLSAGEVSVVAVGDVSAAAVASRLRGGPWTRGREPLDERRHPDTTGPLVEVDLAPTAESMVAVGFRLPRSDVEETAALEVLAAALGGGPTSRVARTPLARSGLVVGTRAFVAPGRQGGVLVLTASLEGGEVSSAVEAMTALALAAGDEELTPAELEAARQALLGADAATAAGAEGAARRLGREAALGYEPDLGARWRAAVFAIDAATVAHHARERLRPSTLSVALLTGEHVRGEDEQGWPVVEGEAGELRRDVERLRNEIRTAVSRATDHASARPDPSPVTAGVRRVELAGGAVVLVSQEPAATEAAIVVALPGAAAWQADRRSGGAPLLATLLRREGTGPSPAPTPLRGALESTLDHDALSASGEFLPGELATALRSVGAGSPGLAGGAGSGGGFGMATGAGSGASAGAGRTQRSIGSSWPARSRARRPK